jgi:hypothetical protein
VPRSAGSWTHFSGPMQPSASSARALGVVRRGVLQSVETRPRRSRLQIWCRSHASCVFTIPLRLIVETGHPDCSLGFRPSDFAKKRLRVARTLRAGRLISSGMKRDISGPGSPISHESSLITGPTHRWPDRRLETVQSGRLPAFQADHAGSIPVGRSLLLTRNPALGTTPRTSPQMAAP